MRILLAPLLMAAIFLAAFSAWSAWRFGGLHQGVQFLYGKTVVVDRPTVQLDRVAPGQTAIAEFSLQNLSGRPVEIYGARLECDCTTAHGFPLTLGPRERRPVQLSLAVSPLHRGGTIIQRAKLLMNLDHVPVILAVEAQVLAAEESLGRE